MHSFIYARLSDHGVLVQLVFKAALAYTPQTLVKHFVYGGYLAKPTGLPCEPLGGYGLVMSSC